MKVTLDEAGEKMCPYTIGSRLGVEPCRGTACMGWQWVGWRDIHDGSIWTGDEPRTEDDERVGHCKRACDARA